MQAASGTLQAFFDLSGKKKTKASLRLGITGAGLPTVGRLCAKTIGCLEGRLGAARLQVRSGAVKVRKGPLCCCVNRMSRNSMNFQWKFHALRRTRSVFIRHRTCRAQALLWKFEETTGPGPA